MSKLLVQRFADWEINSPEHLAIKAFLAANGIPVDAVPSNTRFVVFAGEQPKIQIALFYMPYGKRQASFTGNGYVKVEREFDLVSPLEQFGVRTVNVGEAYNLVDPDPVTESRVREIVDEKSTELAKAI